MSEQTDCTPDMTPGRISWTELATNDVEGAKKFYGALFGWTAHSQQVVPGMEYTCFQNGAQPAGGLLQMPAEAKGAPPMWLSYVTVADVAAALAKAQSLGAKVIKEVTTLPMGSFALIADPQGAVLGLWEFAQPGK